MDNGEVLENWRRKAAGSVIKLVQNSIAAKNQAGKNKNNKELDLKELGNRIGMVDYLIITLLSKRISELARQVVKYKKAHGEQLIRPQVEESRLAAVRNLAKEKGLDSNFVFTLFWSIIAETCRVQIAELQNGVSEENLSPAALKQNLIELGKEIAPLYDQTYGQAQFATRIYTGLEDKILHQEIGNLRVFGNTDMAVDLGCATGRETFLLAKHFARVVGYDISPAMVEQAQKLNKLANAEFRVADIESGIPEVDGSVSLVVMNLGTASDIGETRRVLASIKRVLKPNGRFLLSFYNSGALLYNCWFLPWAPALSAKLDEINHCLEVRLKNRVFCVPARAYTKREVEVAIKKEGLVICQIMTHPTISSILPNEFFVDGNMKNTIGEIDAKLSSLDSGAYILVTGRKPV